MPLWHANSEQIRLIVAKLNPMPLHAQPQIFEFEIASSENLSYIPMCIRFNLDRCELRLTLAQWQALPYRERLEFTTYPLLGSGDSVDGFVQALAERLAGAGAGELAPMAEAPDMAWACTEHAPSALLRQCVLHRLAPIGDSVWGHLPEFQRYVLSKLSRRNSANHDFLAAVREFGLSAGPFVTKSY